MRKLLLFKLANANFGIWENEVQDVKADLVVHSLPYNNKCIAGVARLRDRFLSIADLSFCMGYAQTETGDRTVLAMPGEKEVAGFVVPGNIESVECDDDAVFSIQKCAQSTIVDSCASYQNKPIPIINISALHNAVQSADFILSGQSLQFKKATKKKNKAKLFLVECNSHPFALRTTGIEEAITKPEEIATLSQLPEYAEGLILYNQQAVPLVSLSRRLGFSGEDRNTIVLPVMIEEQVVCFLVSGEGGELTSQQATGSLPPLVQSRWLEDVLIHENTIIPIIDLPELLMPDADVKQAEDTRQYNTEVSFEPGSADIDLFELSLIGAKHAIPKSEITDSLEIQPVTRIPNVAPMILGVFEYKGEVLPVLDLAICYGEVSSVTSSWKMVLVENGTFKAFVVTDRVFDSYSLQSDFQRALPINLSNRFVYGCYTDRNSSAVILILNVPEIAIHYKGETSDSKLAIFAKEFEEPVTHRKASIIGTKVEFPASPEHVKGERILPTVEEEPVEEESGVESHIAETAPPIEQEASRDEVAVVAEEAMDEELAEAEDSAGKAQEEEILSSEEALEHEQPVVEDDGVEGVSQRENLKSDKEETELLENKDEGESILSTAEEESVEEESGVESHIAEIAPPIEQEASRDEVAVVAEETMDEELAEAEDSAGKAQEEEILSSEEALEHEQPMEDDDSPEGVSEKEVTQCDEPVSGKEERDLSEIEDDQTEEVDEVGVEPVSSLVASGTEEFDSVGEELATVERNIEDQPLEQAETSCEPAVTLMEAEVAETAFTDSNEEYSQEDEPVKEYDTENDAQSATAGIEEQAVDEAQAGIEQSMAETTEDSREDAMESDEYEPEKENLLTVADSKEETDIETEFADADEEDTSSEAEDGENEITADETGEFEFTAKKEGLADTESFRSTIEMTTQEGLDDIEYDTTVPEEHIELEEEIEESVGPDQSEDVAPADLGENFIEIEKAKEDEFDSEIIQEETVAEEEELESEIIQEETVVEEEEEVVSPQVEREDEVEFAEEKEEEIKEVTGVVEFAEKTRSKLKQPDYIHVTKAIERESLEPRAKSSRGRFFFLAAALFGLVVVFFIAPFQQQDPAIQPLMKDTKEVFRDQPEPKEPIQVPDAPIPLEETKQIGMAETEPSAPEEVTLVDKVETELASPQEATSVDKTETGPVAPEEGTLVGKVETEPAPPQKTEITPPLRPAEPEVKTIIYVVKEGDYLFKITKAYTGDGYLYPKIQKDNKIPNADLIYPDQVIKIKVEKAPE